MDRERTGIRQRHIARRARRPPTWRSKRRARAADAGIDAGELDLIVCATTTPDETFPPSPP
jgi:3-oxoacyl-[acyl-carrier-protein] synthase-3